MKNDLQNALNENKTVSVVFRTKKGSYRTMDCTSNLAFVPLEQQDGRLNPDLNQPGVACVYDHMVRQWRAFRFDTVVDWNII